jgi:hypothetical protein
VNEANRSTNESFRVVALVTASASVAPDALVYGSDQDGNLYLRTQQGPLYGVYDSGTSNYDTPSGPIYGTVVSRETSYKWVCKNSINLRGRKLGVRPSYKSVLFDDTFLKFYTTFADNVSQQKRAMSIEDQMPVAYYLRVSTETQELDKEFCR